VETPGKSIRCQWQLTGYFRLTAALEKEKGEEKGRRKRRKKRRRKGEEEK
jgi:hypothetical protein